MALINCPECGKEISDKAVMCPNCGYHMKQSEKTRKKLVVIPIIIFVIICVILIVNITLTNQNPARQAIKILEDDMGERVNIIGIYYNKDQNGYIVEFSSKGINDIACIHLKDKSIGYESVLNDLQMKVDGAITKEEKKEYLEILVDYYKVYNVKWVCDLYVNGTAENGWIKIQ